MATTVSVKPTQSPQKAKRPPSLQTSVNGTSPAPSSSSPSMGSKRPPSMPTQTSNSAVNGTIVNGTAARPGTRQRKESQRSLQAKISNGRAVILDGIDNNTGSPRKKLCEPYVRTTEYILQKFKGVQPSLVLHLHPTHFRFDQQDGSFSYNSPMKVLLEHIKAQTVPHDILEELFQANVPFYDGCLIVQVHDHKSATATSKTPAADVAGEGQNEPASMHNYSQHTVPSPYVPYRSKAKRKLADTMNGELDSKAETTSMPAPERPAKKPPTPVFTTVLHPTSQTRHRELSILATTAAPETRAGRKQMNQRDAATPLSAVSATPLTSLPSTSAASKGPAPKKQRMMLEENDYHSFEGEVLRCTEPPLCLDQADSFEDVQAIMKSLAHPLHSHKPSAPKGRKRTVAELAADEAQAAEDERIALIMDERLNPSLSAAGSGTGTTTADGHTAAKDFEPNFARFKTLEDIKQRLIEEAARKKEQMQEEERMKREAAAENKRREDDKQRQMKLLQQQAQQQAAQQAMMQSMQQPGALRSNSISMGGMVPNLQQSHMQQVSQGQQMSPNMPHHPQMSSSPLVGNIMSQRPPSAGPMSASLSGQGAGSPPRPPSTAQQAPTNMGVPMNRQVSQQRSQTGQSQGGTPQMPHATPQIGNQNPALRHMTPQQRMAQGSPASGVMQNSHMAGMMATPQMNGQNLTPQQQLMLQQRAAQMQGSPTHANMSPQQQQQLYMQQLAARQQQFQNLNPQQQMQYQRMLAQQRAQQQQAQQGQSHPPNQPNLQNQQQGQQPQPQNLQFQQQQQQLQQQANSSQGGGMQMATSMSQNPSQQQQFAQQMGMPQGMSMTPQQQQAQHQWQQAIQQTKNMFLQKLASQNGGQLPPDAEQQFIVFMRQRQQIQQAQAARQQQQSGQMGQAMMMGQSQQGSPPGAGAGGMLGAAMQAQAGGGGGMPAASGHGPSPQQQQYMAAMQQRQQQLMLAQQRQAAARAQQITNGMPQGQGPGGG